MSRNRKRPFTVMLSDRDLEMLATCAIQSRRTAAEFLRESLPELCARWEVRLTDDTRTRIQRIVRNAPLPVDTKYDFVFHCPQCGGSYFGTSWPGALIDASEEFFENAMGYCSNCRFTWPRKNDHLHFDVVIKPSAVQ